MGCDEFRFKRFTLRQQGCALKMGTDGVLLGAWCELPAAGRLLDVGTGCGVIALMAAQRNPSLRIDAVEVDPPSAACARANVAASPWAGSVCVIEGDVRRAALDPPYDAIVSNPPFFDDSLRSPCAARAAARHTFSLPHAQLLEAAASLLAPTGSLSLILPSAQAARLLRLAAARSLFLVRRTDVRTVSGAPVKRVLLQFSPQCRAQPRYEELAIAHSDGAYTAAYRALMHSFYLDM